MKLKNDFYAMLGFAARARACVSGYTAVEMGIRKKNILLVILDEAISGNSLERITALCKTFATPWIVAGPPGEAGMRIGKPAAKMIGITGEMFARRMLQLTQQSAERTEVED